MKWWKIAIFTVVLIILAGCGSPSTTVSTIQTPKLLPNTGGLSSEVQQFSCGAGDSVHTVTVYGNAQGKRNADVWQSNGYCYIVVPMVPNPDLPVTVGALSDPAAYVAVTYNQVPPVSVANNRIVFFGLAEYHPAESVLYPGFGWSSGLVVEFVPIKGEQQTPMSASLALSMLSNYVAPNTHVWAFNDTRVGGATVCTQLSQALAPK